MSKCTMLRQMRLTMIHDLKVNLLGESFQFYTDAGVFKKDD